MPEQTGDFIWYELLTSDAAAAERFYGEVVGWSFHDPDGSGYVHISASPDQQIGGLVQLTPEMQQGGARPGWLGYVHVADVDAEAAAWERAGGRVQMPAMDIPNVGRIALLADPQGVPLYVMTPAAELEEGGDSAAFSTTEARHVRWNELDTPEDARALAFYGERFGWTKLGAMPMGEMGDYTFIAANGVGIGAVMRSSNPSWRYYIGVDDIDRAAAAVEGGGGAVLDGPHEIPGGDFSLHGRDPQGAAFGLVGPRKG
jgi:uncharacterized protein